MPTHDLAAEQVSIHDLRPHPKNPRNGDTDAIGESLRINGQYRPIVVAQDGTVLAGNHTYAAAMELGWDTLSVVRLDVDPFSGEARRIMLADNRTADLGKYDNGLLLDALLDLTRNDQLGLLGTGYDEEALNALLQPPVEGDADTDDPDHNWSLVVECQTRDEQETALQVCVDAGLQVRTLA